MKKIVLDTSFILAALEKKIDFFDHIELEGFDILVPEQVIKELIGLGAKLALNILEKNKFELLKVPGKDADAAIIAFARKNPGAVVATLDLGLQRKIRNHKMIIRGSKKLEIT